MNSSQESKLNMYRSTQTHCELNTAIILSVPAFNEAYNIFKTKIAAILSTVQQQDLVTKGITVDKTTAKETLCRLTTDIAASIFAYASKENNNTLMQQVDFPYSDLFRTKDDQLAPRCQNIADAATANATFLADYGISAATIDSLNNAISNYQSQVPHPRNAAATKSTLAANLKVLIKETDGLLKNQLDKTLVGFRTAHPDFIRTYKNNRIIIDPGKKITTLTGIITSSADNAFIKDAKILITEKALQATTNENGEYTIKPCAPGKYTITISANNYITKEVDAGLIKQGKITEQNFTLDPA